MRFWKRNAKLKSISYLLIWKETPGGFTHIKGMFRKDQWGVAERIAANEQGIWKLPIKYVKHFK